MIFSPLNLINVSCNVQGINLLCLGVLKSNNVNIIGREYFNWKKTKLYLTIWSWSFHFRLLCQFMLLINIAATTAIFLLDLLMFLLKFFSIRQCLSCLSVFKFNKSHINTMTKTPKLPQLLLMHWYIPEIFVVFIFMQKISWLVTV